MYSVTSTYSNEEKVVDAAIYTGIPNVLPLCVKILPITQIRINHTEESFWSVVTTAAGNIPLIRQFSARPTAPGTTNELLVKSWLTYHKQ
jgi:hypothetical protein